MRWRCSSAITRSTPRRPRRRTYVAARHRRPHGRRLEDRLCAGGLVGLTEALVSAVSRNRADPAGLAIQGSGERMTGSAAG